MHGQQNINIFHIPYLLPNCCTVFLLLWIISPTCFDHISAIFRELTRLSTSAAYVSAYMGGILHIVVHICN